MFDGTKTSHENAEYNADECGKAEADRERGETHAEIGQQFAAAQQLPPCGADLR
jgi:hypothetical protein